MKSNILASIIACAALTITAPAFAKPGGGKGPGGAPGLAKGRGHSVLVPGPTVRTSRGPNYGVNVCPPGLAAKLNGCLPPGQAKRLFDLGQRVPRGYGFYTPLDNIPLIYRNQIPGAYLGGDYDYIYRNNSIYVVDPTTRRPASLRISLAWPSDAGAW